MRGPGPGAREPPARRRSGRGWMRSAWCLQTLLTISGRILPRSPAPRPTRARRTAGPALLLRRRRRRARERLPDRRQQIDAAEVVVRRDDLPVGPDQEYPRDHHDLQPLELLVPPAA